MGGTLVAAVVGAGGLVGVDGTLVAAVVGAGAGGTVAGEFVAATPEEAGIVAATAT